MINSSSDNVRKLNSINRRMFITGSLKFFIMIGIVSRLFFLQVKENKKYLTLSDKNRIREWKLAPVRGEFQDYFGNTIAGNFEAYQLHVIPEQVEDFRYVIYRVKDLLELDDNPIWTVRNHCYWAVLSSQYKCCWSINCLWTVAINSNVSSTHSLNMNLFAFNAHSCW